MKLRSPSAAERDQVVALLERSQLPTADLGSSHVDFIVAVEDGAVVGTVGIEPHECSGLLRSLAVAEPLRGSGLGGQLVAAIEARAAQQGLDALVLLTTTAKEFFARRRTIDRSDAPEPVRRSTEFRALCPASSTCMIKPLGVR